LIHPCQFLLLKHQVLQHHQSVEIST
jgi:hypothetical protein